MVLDKIQRPNDVKELKEQELPILADEIRQFIIDKVSDNGGHLASNLGVVELTIALHRCLNFPQDKLIWDVGHQSYTHKILTGRKNGFDSLRKYHGMSGFPKRDEVIVMHLIRVIALRPYQQDLVWFVHESSRKKNIKLFL